MTNEHVKAVYDILMNAVLEVDARLRTLSMDRDTIQIGSVRSMLREEIEDSGLDWPE